MKLEILGIQDVVMYEPKDKTYAIRLFSNEKEVSFFKLKASSLYQHIFSYVFNVADNDNDPHEKITNEFNEEMAEKIIRDFSEHGKTCDTLLVHCTYGKKRSPAVAIALNDIFRLENNSIALKEKYPGYIRSVYEIMKKAAKKIRDS